METCHDPDNLIVPRTGELLLTEEERGRLNRQWRAIHRGAHPFQVALRVALLAPSLGEAHIEMLAAFSPITHPRKLKGQEGVCRRGAKLALWRAYSHARTYGRHVLGVDLSQERKVQLVDRLLALIRANWG